MSGIRRQFAEAHAWATKIKRWLFLTLAYLSQMGLKVEFESGWPILQLPMQDNRSQVFTNGTAFLPDDWQCCLPGAAAIQVGDSWTCPQPGLDHGPYRGEI